MGMCFRRNRPLPFHRNDFPKDLWIHIGYGGLRLEDQAHGPNFRRGLDWPLPSLDVTFCHAVGEVPYTRKVLRGRKTSLFPKAGSLWGCSPSVMPTSSLGLELQNVMPERK